MVAPKKIRPKIQVVAVGVLKAKLSEYLKIAREGQEVIVTDHKVPIAKVVAFEDLDFHVQEPTKPLKKIHDLINHAADGKTDSLSILLEDRRKG